MAKLPRLLTQYWRGMAVVVLLLVAAAVLYWWPVSQRSEAFFVLRPSQTSLQSGQEVVVKVYVDSNQAANAVDVTVDYPTDQLEVVGTSTKGTRFDMVLFPPDSKTTGKVRFLQATAAPFTGHADTGLVGTITFKAKTSQADIGELTATGKVIANNEHGTDLAKPKPDKPLWRTIVNK